MNETTRTPGKSPGNEEVGRMRSADHEAQIGAKLRRVRERLGLTLEETYARLGSAWRSTDLEAYEHGKRSISISRLAELAAFYGVPLAELMPDPEDDRRRPEHSPAEKERQRPSHASITIDLTRLAPPDLDPVARFAEQVRILRGNHVTRVIALRERDVSAIAMSSGRTLEELLGTLSEAGALVEVDLTGEPTLRVTDRRRASELSTRPA